MKTCQTGNSLILKKIRMESIFRLARFSQSIKFVKSIKIFLAYMVLGFFFISLPYKADTAYTSYIMVLTAYTSYTWNHKLSYTMVLPVDLWILNGYNSFGQSRHHITLFSNKWTSTLVTLMPHATFLPNIQWQVCQNLPIPKSLALPPHHTGYE